MNEKSKSKKIKKKLLYNTKKSRNTKNLEIFFTTLWLFFILSNTLINKTYSLTHLLSFHYLRCTPLMSFLRVIDSPEVILPAPTLVSFALPHLHNKFLLHIGPCLITGREAFLCTLGSICCTRSTLFGFMWLFPFSSSVSSLFEESVVDGMPRYWPQSCSFLVLSNLPSISQRHHNLALRLSPNSKLTSSFAVVPDSMFGLRNGVASLASSYFRIHYVLGLFLVLFLIDYRYWNYFVLPLRGSVHMSRYTHCFFFSSKLVS